MTNDLTVLASPSYCQYAAGKCDQSFGSDPELRGFFIFPSDPPHLARTVGECVRLLRDHGGRSQWLSWEDLSMGGQIVFCEICKAIRRSSLIVANVTTSNFNVLFELGYAIGLGKPVLPIKDTSYERQRKLFDEIGIFDTLGYESFANSNQLHKIVMRNRRIEPAVRLDNTRNKQQPVYYIKSPVDSDGSIKLFSCLKKSAFRFRTFDSRETIRLSLHEACKQVLCSVTVIAHLIDPERQGAAVHNARAAFVCGMALASEKHVLMIQEAGSSQPIDYRDLVIPYDDASMLPQHIEHVLRLTADTIQSVESTRVPLPKNLLERIDLGDVAAENEIQSLANYFVKTPQFQQTRQGHARLVIGRKGSGKSALFYGIRSQFRRRDEKIVLDLKPEGHQFTRLREVILGKLSEGLQLHTLTAFWHYLLLLELANKLVNHEARTAFQSPASLAEYEELRDVFARHSEPEGDFSERLMALVRRIIERFPQTSIAELTSAEITSTIYNADIAELVNVVCKHLERLDGVWVLFDNIDKGFPTHGLTDNDVLVVRALLDATRRLERSLEKAGIDCTACVFLRRDVFDLLIDSTPDRGKDSYVSLDWSDEELVKELLLRRFQYQAGKLGSTFSEVWGRLFEAHVNGESSFRYILARTFLRPRDILNLVRKCVQIAVSRGHERVEEDDIIAAEAQYSEDVLNELHFEIRDIFPNYRNILVAFLDAGTHLTQEDVYLRLLEEGVPDTKLEDVRNMLLWFSFLGVAKQDEEHYSYQFDYNMPNTLLD